MKGKFKISYNAPVVLAIVAISFIATLLGFISGDRITHALFMTYRAPLSNPLTWIRAFTHVFGHSGWAHFAGNMSYILLLGPLLEEKYSSGMLIMVTAVTAFVTSLINFVLFPSVALCGASGVVFAFILLSSFTSFKEGEIPLTFILVTVFFIGQQVIDAITVRDNISNLSHIIGGVIGGVIGYLMNKTGAKRE